MRISVPAAALALGGSLALGALVAPAALATPAVPVTPAAATCQGFGVAGLYGEFVEGDDSHGPDAEGAVAVGGNADFGHGFSVGQELTDAQVKALPGGNALVVGGNITVGDGNTEVMKGNGVYAGRKFGAGRLEGHAGTVVHGPSPIDFAAEFATLRGLSAALAARGASAGSTVLAEGSGAAATLTLTGTDSAYNGFVVSAAQLEGARAIRLKVPAGAVAVVTVTGEGYDSRSAGTTSMWLWDHTKQGYVLDDKLQSADGGAVRAALLWNLPTATTVVKNSALAWAGSVLAPDAAFDLGTGGPVNGSVIARSLTGSGGAETHHSPFTACLPVPPVPSGAPSLPPTVPSSSPPSGGPAAPSAPVSTPSTPGSTPGGPSTPGVTASPTAPTAHPATTPAGARPSGSAPAPAAVATTPSGGAVATPGAASPSPAAPHGGLAFTGADGIVPLTVGGLLVLAAGGGIVLATRRRAARKS
ncbi:hypothetical protein GCM10009665_03420 [Kitasatospora nipponensis]|uniref:Choice-of-anchor A domain-containing protein n=1 Tax=Kitasatospora nipponensis TaxID=258049 RepID=A0ABN1VMD1_9ACTN